jgi:hypothetical protein
MKWILDNKKLWVIIVFVFICGLALQFSRSQFALKTVKNSQQIDQNVSYLNANFENYIVATNPEYCIVHDETSLKLKENIERTLQYIQKTYFSYDSSKTAVDFSNCEQIILTTGFLTHLGSVEEIENFVLEGGNLFLMNRLEPYDAHFQLLAPSLGIVDTNGYTNSTSINMNSNLLIGAEKNSFLDGELDDSSLNVELNVDTKVYATNQNQNGLIWKNSYGKGQFMILNATIAQEKVSRGVIVGMLSLMNDTYIYPIFNSKTFYIDDFPSPIAKIKNKLIHDEYRMDLPTFYHNIWWTDMLQIAKKYNITYTGALIETYNNRITPPFEDVNENVVNYLISFGREIIKSGGEIGVHGYNHQSLTMDKNLSKEFGYNPWTTTDDMKKSLEELLSYTNSALPSYKITSYVPPSNVLSSEGRRILKEALPDLIVIASLYNEDFTKLSYIQEFEVADDQIMELPRVSSGYFPSISDDWSIANAITSLGIFSHFVHPDDVISEDRSGGNWSEMHTQFENYMQNIDDQYPWLRAQTATEAAFSTAAALQTSVQLIQTDDQINGTIKNFNENKYFILRTNKKIKNGKNCDIKKIDNETYLITVKAEQFQIKLKRDSS